MVQKKASFKNMSWYDVKLAIESGCDTIILPLGSVEQHGPHLPLTTDSIVVEWIAERTAEITEGVLTAPIIYYGVSDNHMDFAGTGSVKVDTLKQMIIDVGVSLLSHGFKNLILLNGHGGNNATVAIAAHEIRNSTGKFVGAITWPSMVIEAEKTLESEIVWHADEGETSTILWIDAGLVNIERAVKEDPKPIPHFEFTHEALFNNKVDQGLPKTKDITNSGIIGDATLATPEKGKMILEEAVKNLSKTIMDLRNA